jgi:hypothetical protein
MKVSRTRSLKQRYENVLGAFGLARQFYSLKPRFQKEIVSRSFPGVSVALHNPDLESDAATQSAIRDLQAAIDGKRGTIEPCQKDIRLQDYFGIALSLAHQGVFFDPDTRPSEKKPAEFIASANLAILKSDATVNALICLARTIDAAISRHSDIRVAVYGYEFRNNRDSCGLPKIEVIVHKQVQQEKRISMSCDMGTRTCFACAANAGGLCDTAPIESVHWNNSHHPVVPPGEEWPVFIQSHLLMQLETRLKADSLFKKWYLHDCLWYSLKFPDIIAGNHGQTLASYFIDGKKAGYLPVTVENGRVVVDTFLFLTMDGTPESKRLYDKLKIQRKDREFIGWDSIETFLLSDLREDGCLRKILADCGCGHLFDLAQGGVLPHLIRGSAEQARKYLNL